MFKKIKKKWNSLNIQLKKIDNDLPILKENSKTIVENNQIQFDFAQINQLFSAAEYIPFTRWSLSPSTIAHILNDIVINSRKNIVEFGSGTSTFYIAKIIQKLKLEATFISVESDKDWIIKMKSLINKYSLNDYVNIIYAPLKEVPEEISFDDKGQWYDSEILKKQLNFEEPVDLVVVDGPWGGLCRLSRYPAIPFLKKDLSKSFTVVLDDTFRDAEKQILRHWCDQLNSTSKEYNKYSVISSDKNYKLEPLPLNVWQRR